MAITACATKLKQTAKSFADESNVTIAANSDTPFHEILDVTVALSGTQATPLFPAVAFAMPM